TRCGAGMFPGSGPGAIVGPPGSVVGGRAILPQPAGPAQGAGLPLGGSTGELARGAAGSVNPALLAELVAGRHWPTARPQPGRGRRPDQAWTQTTSPAVARERVTYGEPTPELHRPGTARQRGPRRLHESRGSRREAGPATVAGAVSGVGRGAGS